MPNMGYDLFRSIGFSRNKQSLISNYNAFMVFSGPLTLDSKG